MEKTAVKKIIKHTVRALKEKKTQEPAKPTPKIGKYFESVGRRKTAIARVRLFSGESSFLINGKQLEQYFLDSNLQRVVKEVLNKMECADKFSVTAKVSGGGINAQAEAIRHGIARTLVSFDPDFRKRLKKSGFLTRDPRMRERKKFGLKRARRAPQWSKR
jgi:small subunit ribosomal protein S9